jgi:hypothetical protein
MTNNYFKVYHYIPIMDLRLDEMKWTPIFGPRAKEVLQRGCSTKKGSMSDEKYAYQVHCGVQG